MKKITLLAKRIYSWPIWHNHWVKSTFVSVVSGFVVETILNPNFSWTRSGIYAAVFGAVRAGAKTFVDTSSTATPPSNDDNAS